MRARLSQALVLAIVQAAKVLGVHCVAKGVDSHPTAQWLAANGIDYMQGKVLDELGALV